MKEDYEAKALAKAEAKGPKEVAEISLNLDLYSFCQQHSRQKSIQIENTEYVT